MRFYHFSGLLGCTPTCAVSKPLSKRRARGTPRPHCCWSRAAKKWKIHRTKYTDTKQKLLRKYSAIIDCLGNSSEWVLRDRHDGCFLRNTEKRGGMFLGPSLVISRHHSELPNTSWTVVIDDVFVLPLYRKCVRNCVRSDPLSSLRETLLPTLTTEYVRTLGPLSQLRWCGVTARLGQLTPRGGWSLRHLCLAFPWEALFAACRCASPLPFGEPRIPQEHQPSPHMLAPGLGKQEAIKGRSLVSQLFVITL